MTIELKYMESYLKQIIEAKSHNQARFSFKMSLGFSITGSVPCILVQWALLQSAGLQHVEILC